MLPKRTVLALRRIPFYLRKCASNLGQQFLHFGKFFNYVCFHLLFFLFALLISYYTNRILQLPMFATFIFNYFRDVFTLLKQPLGWQWQGTRRR